VNRSRSAALILALAVAAGSAGAAWQSVQVRIVSPAPDSFVSGQITLEAAIEPVTRRREVNEIQFFADGVQVCRSVDVVKPTCRWDAGPTLKSHLIRVVATLTAGGRVVASARTRGVDYVDSVDVRAVQVNVAVLDRRGNFVRGLTKDRFRLREDGVLQTITNFGDENSPLELVLAVDVSGSMGTVIEDLKDAVRQFLSQLRPVDQVTLVAFNEEMFVLARRETDAAARERAVDALASWGNTSLYDVITRSLELLSRQPGRRGLVIFSDGEDSSSQTTLEAVDRAIKASDATLFTVALGRGRESQQLKATLETLAEPSGGRVVMAERSEDLRRAFSDVLEDLQHQYLLGYQSTNPKLDGSWRQLSVEVPGENYRVRARQGYLAVKP
jgi:Ca-activated chloride channel family protein